MPRYARMIVPDEETVYHVMSRTCLEGFPFGDVEKEELVKIIRRFSSVYFVDVLGYCILGNHFHLVLKMIPENRFTDDDIKKRFEAFYGNSRFFAPGQVGYFRSKWSKLSLYMKEIKQTFSVFYNRRHNRRGTLWGERFKSVIVENGETLVNCLAYVDLNAIRAGIVQKPEEYRWCSLGYHVQTGNKDGFLSLDFGQIEFGVKDPKERLRRYRRFVYEAGDLDKSDKPSRNKIDPAIAQNERKKDFEFTRTDRFKYRTRHFSDSGIIGSKAFVSKHYQRFKDRFNSKNEKKPKTIKGLDGIFSLKQLVE